MLAEALRAARESNGWTREVLASEAGLTPQVVKRLESGVGSVANLVAAMMAVDLRLTGVGRGSALPVQLRNRRTRLGFTLDEAAHKSGISRTTLVGLEQGLGTVAPLGKAIAALAPGARRARPIIASWSYNKHTDRDKRFTPAWFLSHVEAAFGAIDLDPCGHELAAVRARRKIMITEDGLASSWAGANLVFMNPPFSDLVSWLRRAADAYERGECQKIVMLIPTRTDSSTFHGRLVPMADIGFLRGRIKFDAPDALAYHAPFSMMVCIAGATEEEVQRFADLVPATWLMRKRSIDADAAIPRRAANDLAPCRAGAG